MEPVAEDRLANGVEAAEALDVDVQELARALALVTEGVSDCLCKQGLT